MGYDFQFCIYTAFKLGMKNGDFVFFQPETIEGKFTLVVVWYEEAKNSCASHNCSCHHDKLSPTLELCNINLSLCKCEICKKILQICSLVSTPYPLSAIN